MADRNFSESMSLRPDEDLIRIAFSTDEDGYVPAAIKAAQEELDRRNILTGPSDAFKITMDQADEERDAYSQKHLDSLTNYSWVLFVIFGPILIITVPVVIAIGWQGYRKKRNEAILAILFSYIFWWGIIMLVLAIFYLLND